MFRKERSTNGYIDPVCLVQLNPDVQHPTFTYQMRTFHFCDDACRQSFEQNPESYLGEENPRKKTWWQRYVDRINKATGGKPPSCCQ